MLKFNSHSNIKMATVYGTVEIDKDGVVKGLTAEQEKAFKDVHGFEYTEEKKQTIKEAPKAEEKPETKEEPKVEEKEAPKKPAPRRTTAKKTEASK